MTVEPPRRLVTLTALVRALDDAVVAVPVLPTPPPEVGSVTLIDADDLLISERHPVRTADVCVLAGVPEPTVRRWLEGLVSLTDRPRPSVVLTKVAGSPLLEQAARLGGVALVTVHPQARSETVLARIRGLLDHSYAQHKASPGLGPATDDGTDLFGLARTVAALTNGMVSIEDDRSVVLAYSASDDTADEVRRMSILGREGPADYLRRLREWGVFDRLRRTDEVVEVPADVGLGLRRRLVVSIRALDDPAAADATGIRPVLGTIWVQEGHQPLSRDAQAALRGASAVAARLITRSLNAPSNEAMQIQRLLGARGGGVDVPSLAAALSISMSGPAVVIGFTALDGERSSSLAELSSALRLHASAYARESLVTVIGTRVYVLLPRTTSPSGVTAWTGRTIERLRAHSGVDLRAAVAAPVANLADVGAARVEVDRVLDATGPDRRVTTLADSRTPVLLGEITDLIAGRDDLRDPRVAALVDYDQRHGSSMRASVEEYLRYSGDVRTAAEALRIHPNTLRYRIGRAEALLDLDLADPAARLLVELQLMVLRRLDTTSSAPSPGTSAPPRPVRRSRPGPRPADR